MIVMPKIVDHEERRRAIASAAVGAIAETGLDGVRLADIAQRAGLTTGAVAHYFPDKDAVLAAALEEVCTRLFIRMGPPDGPQPAEDIGDCLPLDRDRHMEWRVWLAYWGRAPWSETLRTIHRQYYTDIEQAVIDDLTGHVADPAMTAAAVIAAVDGVGTRAILDPEGWPEARQRAVLAHLLAPILPD